MNITTEWTDPELGIVRIRVNKQARHIILRASANGILITIPPQTEQERITECLSLHRNKLKSLQAKSPSTRIDFNYRIETDLFQLSISPGTLSRFTAKSSLGKMEIICPNHTNFNEDEIQLWLQKVIREGLRKNAQALLPLRLQRLAQQWNLTYKQVRINASKGRWGSCSIQKHINLSLNLLLLPSHLIDYVLLHELAHTVEMNHGQKFWTLLNQMTDQQAFSLRQELKKYHPKF